MSYNGSGTFLINTAGQPVVSGTVISSTAFNALTADLATGLSTAITKDGQTTVTANIPMGTYKFTGLGAGTAATDSANLSQVQSTVTKLLVSVSGADTITAVGSPTLGAYAAGQMFYFVAAADNTGAVTLNIDSLGAKSVTRDGSVALAAGDIKSGEVVVVVYDGTRFQVVSQLNSSGDARFANVSIASTLYVGGVATFTSGTAAAPAITTSGDTNTGIFFPAADTIAFAEGGVEAARFDSSGNMGLGVTPAAWGANSAIQLADSQSYSRYGMARNAYYDGAAYRYVTSAPASLYQQSANEHIWYQAASGTAGATISFTQAITLDASGNLGIGTSSPAYKLDVAGTGGTAARIRSSSAYSGLLLSSQDSNAATRNWLVASNWNAYGDLAIVQSNAQNGDPITAGTTRLAIDSSGNLGLGVTPSAWGNNYKGFEIVGAGAAIAANGSNAVTIGTGNYINSAGNFIYTVTGTAVGRYDLNSGLHRWYNAPSGTAGNTISFTQALTLNANGNLALQGGTTTASGVGVTFPASQSASSDANCLDDYEEGTFTPTIGAGITSPTYASRTGRYTKIGRLVYITIGVTLNGGTRNASQLQIAGLPFNIGTTGAGTGFTMAYSDQLVSSTTTNQPWLYGDALNPTITMYKTDGGGFFGTDAVSANIRVDLSGCYNVD